VERLPFADTLAGLVDSMVPTRARGAGVRVDTARIALPLEVRVAGTPDEPLLLANAPRWRWTTEFDSRPGFLDVSLTSGERR
jgi:hypothetical protein